MLGCLAHNCPAQMFQMQIIEKLKTHILYATNFFFPENRTIC
jgi:hypothetical protein